MDTKKLAGSLKVAILIQSAGKVESQKILNSLSSSERELVKKHLSQMGMISPDVVEKVAKEFTEMARSVKLPQIKDASMSEEDAGSSVITSNLELLQSLETDRLIQLIKDEHPQTIAIIIVHLKTETASKILSGLPDEIKTDVAVRIANLGRVESGMIEEIAEVFEDVLKSSKGSAIREAGGVDRLAEILNQIDGVSGGIILNEIEENDSELADQIKQGMFVFEDLVLVDNQGFQKLLRKIETKELAMALKAASDEVKEKVFSNMSERAAEILNEEVEVMGSVRMSEVAVAQQAVTRIIQDMEAKKELIISGRGGEEFIG
ncbi:MAG: flagellar motor switch protein FliG [Deltaproteobacteria bacterium]|nr:flagellar motor switch protein FliG [Deltaproteobacteria bacterium]MBW1834252.1 flagellar motor switch protein FliG [Deltaproteobacteria bacterium]MBW2165534.1 flagellar motor switch protein FliG [Deltaproteobacteria bacterium]MBW2570327.1 flagellar motor switch protein FliG [Deltaproteobacteria bacterium]